MRFIPMSLQAVVLAVYVTLVLAQPEMLQECPALRISTMRVSFSSVQNKTGHWDTKVAFKQGASGGGHVWLADLDQNIFQCDEKEAVLETTLHLKASLFSAPPMSSQWMPPRYTPAVPPPPPRTPPSGYELFPTVGYYKLHSEKVDWPTARKSCTGEGSHLVILNSEEENEVVKKIFARNSSMVENWVYAGILEFGAHAEWFTLFGTTLLFDLLAQWFKCF